MDKNEFSKYLQNNINESLNALNSKLYHNTLDKKEHTLHCLIHKYFEYFMQEYTIWEIDRCRNQFGCFDANFQNLTFHEFNIKLNEKCQFFRQDYVQYEAQGRVDLAILEMYRAS